MQGKGFVRTFLVILTLVTLWQYFLVLPTQKVESEAADYAEMAVMGLPEDQQKAVYKQRVSEYLDSMSSEEVLDIPMIKSYTYQELKGQQLALGLDLKGGMSVTLQVDLRDLIYSLSDENADPTFQEALEAASEKQRSATTDYVSLFAESWSELAEGKKLAPIFLRNESLRQDLNFESSDGEVIREIRQKANETVNLTFNLLKKRIDKLGVTQPNVSLDEGRDLILVELPGIDNPERARSFLVAAANLEFWNVFRITDGGIQEGLVQANERITAQLSDAEDREIVGYEPMLDSLGNMDSTRVDSTRPIYAEGDLGQGGLFELMSPNGGQYSPAVLGVAEKNKRNRIAELLYQEEIKGLFPPNIEFKWSRSPVKDYETGEQTNLYQLYMIRKERTTNEPPLSGENVTRAQSQPNPINGEPAVSLSMDETGSRIWGQLTTAAAQDNQREIAIVLDDEVVSAPSVNEPILNGSSQISGSFTIQEAEDLASILQVGRLPAEARIIQESVVGPSLGQDNINRSYWALGIGFALVFIFMILYYGGAGIVSIIALFLNMFFILGALASMSTVLTLPGIAGLVLTIGMAVDANVIIFERVREELREGKTLLTAIQDGFSNSYSAIIDANVTTILTAIVLAFFGLGPIKGFAVVLIVGVLSSLFTAVLVGRLMIDWWTSKGRNITFGTSWSNNTLANLNVNWLGKRRFTYIVSGSLLVFSFGSYFIRNFELGVDFKGGYSYNIEFEEEYQAQDLREVLTDAFEGNTPIVKTVDVGTNSFNIVTDYLIDDNSDGAADRVMVKLHQGINELAGGGLDFDNFSDPDGEGTHVTSSAKVLPTIADDIKASSVEAAVFALLLIFLYIFIRFNRWQYSLGAVAALFHDTIIVLGVFAAFHGILPFSMEIDQAFIAAILTVIGYSINDTVVVFDRIREFLGIYTAKSKEEVINMAINSTLSRTLITSLTTLFVMIVLFLFGGASIKGFAFAMVVGVVVGTYSSIFVATPIMSDLSGDLKGKKPTKKATFSRAASKAKA